MMKTILTEDSFKIYYGDWVLDRSVSFERSISFFPIDMLKNIGNMLELKGMSKLKKDELVAFIYAAYPEKIETINYFWEKETLKLLKKLRKGSFVFTGRLEEFALNQLMYLGLIQFTREWTVKSGFVDGRFIRGEYQIILSLPEGAEPIADTILKQRYSKQLKKDRNIFTYMKGALTMYGYLECGEFLRIFNRNYPDDQVTLSEVKTMLRRFSKNTSYPYFFRKDYFCTTELSDKNQSQIKSIRLRHPLPLPSDEEIKKYAEPEFIFQFESVRTLFKLFSEYIASNHLLDVMRFLYLNLQFQGSLSNLMEFLNNEFDFELDSQEEVFQLAGAYQDFNNSIAHWELRGNTPNELSKDIFPGLFS